MKSLLLSTLALVLLTSCGGDTGSTDAGTKDTTQTKSSATANSEDPAPAEKKKTGPPVPADLEPFLDQLESADEFERVGAIMSLAEKEGANHPAVQEAFRNALEDKSPDVKAEAAKALPTILGHAAAVEPLKALLESDDVTVKRAAIEGLGTTQASSAAPAVAACLEDDSDAVQLEALKALGMLNNPEVVGEVRKVLYSPDGTKIQAALRTMVALNARSEGENIRGLLLDMNSDVRGAAAQALGSLGTSDKETLIALASLLTDDLQGVRRHASEALTKLTKAEIEYFYDEADQESLKEGAKLWVDWIEKNK